MAGALSHGAMPDSVSPHAPCHANGAISSPSVPGGCSASRTMIVRGYRADIDPRQLGYTLTAVIRIRPAPGQPHAVVELAQQTPEIAECLRITGE